MIRAGTAVAALPLLLAGCTSAAQPEVEQAARSFYGAAAGGDGQAACALLAPQTAHEVEQSGRAACADAVLDEPLPQPGDIVRTEVFGESAQVRLDGDTVFLARFRDGWKVVAAGCRSQGDRPYDCRLEGS